MWYVGLDWADTHHDVDVLNENGKHVGARRFSHSHEGLNDLKQFLLSFVSQPEELVCVLETTHGLLITSLLEAGIPVYPVNPKTINGLRKVAGAKTDRIDAHLLAKIGYFTRVSRYFGSFLRSKSATARMHGKGELSPIGQAG